MIQLSADFGGSSIKLGMVQGAKVLDRATLPLDGGVAMREILPRLEHHFSEMLNHHGMTASSVDRVGFALPSLIDFKRQVVVSTNDKYADAPEIDLHRWVREHWDCPLVLDNDANAALAGEWYYGAGQGCDDLVLIILGTGIGTSVILDGRPLRGATGQAGSLGGHLTIESTHPKPCVCPNLGCAESLGSTWAMRRDVASSASTGDQSWTEQVNDWGYREIFDRADLGDRMAMTLRDRSLKTWSILAVNLVHAYNPQRIILAGGLLPRAEIIIKAIGCQIAAHAWTIGDGPEIVPAQLAAKAPLLGMTVIGQYFKNVLQQKG